MEITFIQQTTAFIWSVVLGLCLGAVYEGIRILKTAFSFGKGIVFAVDFLFMFMSVICAFLLSVSFLSGYVRLHPVFGCLSGVILFRITIGRVMSQVYGPIIKFFKKASLKIQVYFKKIIKKLLKISHRVLYNICNKIKQLFTRLFGAAHRKKVIEGNEKKEAKKGGKSANGRKRHLNRN